MPQDLQVLPPEHSDIGTQRCRLGPTVMEDLKLRLGSPVLVTLPGGASCLCTAWPRPDLADAYLQLDTTCSSPELDPKALRGLRIGVERLRALSCPCVKRLCVTALVQSDEYKQRTSAQVVRALAAELLMGLYVHNKHLVNISHTGTPVQFLQVDSLNSGSLKAGRVTSETCLELVSVRTVETHRRWARERYAADLGGLEEIQASLKEMLTLPLRYPISTQHVGVAGGRSALLVGPPGVGKTQLVRSVVRDVQAALVMVSGPVVVGSRPGESEENLRAAFTQASEAARDEPCVLFIDEIDALCPKRSFSTGAPENRLVAQLLTLMDGICSNEGFVIIGATNRPDALDPALRRPGRFDREIVVGVPTLQQRYQVLQCVCRSVPLSTSVDLKSIAEMTSGYVGADLSALSREAALQALLHSTQGGADSVQSRGEDGKVRMEHFLKALRLVPPSCLRSSVGVAEFKPVTWEQIGGLEEVKLKLRQSVEWPMKFPEAFVRMGVCRVRGVLLYGPPGCAKTTLVKAAASSSHCSFLTLSGAELYSPYVGDSEKALAQLFRQARACSPSIVFLDEIDSLVGCRDNGGGCRGSSVQAQVLSVLLNELDGVGFKTTERRETGQSERDNKRTCRDQQMQLQEVCNQDVMIVAATNRPDMLDSALLRPGRFDHIIYVPPPDLQARLNILQLHTEKMPLNSDVCLEDLATQTNLFSGADLENLCKEAALLALHEEGMSVSAVQQKHFQKVLHTFQPSISPQQILQHQQLFKHTYS
ncbi:spermatogenesis-associated protein 5-like protein 1 isoform X1 [Tachysurus vachellii]|uniref:spermatogenesis-associated protein 5-like protein 1 isoform X1 n=1 Tax=Tachysurus vachellii TaxID=175792 RepID=UPI00296B1106|nr:spermatogenesis-associated protein 5-like protein 1 isoform X1 [Tachysurus vachellii]